MRAAIIKSLDIIVWIVAALFAIGGLVVGVMAMGNGAGAQGFGIMIGGILYAIVFAGMFFIIIGVHENTKRTADAIERLANK